MSRFRTLCFGVLLVGTISAIPDRFASNPYLHGFANDANAFAEDLKRISHVDLPPHPIASRAIDYAAPTYLPPIQRITCRGSQICVSKHLCGGGYFTADLPSTSQQCSPDTEVCCNYRPPPPPPPPKPTTPPAILCRGNFEACVSPRDCYNGVWQSNGFNQRIPPYAQRCYAPEVCCRIPDPESTALTNDGYVVRIPENPLPTPTIRPYVPLVVSTQRPYEPLVVSTQRPYVPLVVSTQRPYVPLLVTTQRPFIPSTHAPIYLPPDRIAEPSVIRGENQLSLPINPPPKNSIEDPAISLPVFCPAALNCTDVQYCTATGVIAKSPVFLTPEQELYRVPMTDCQDPVKGIIGKCCRDPDYVDPWPVSQLGQYTDPKLFGDDGQYRQDATRPIPQIAPKPLIRDPRPNVFQAQQSQPIYPQATISTFSPIAAPTYTAQLSEPIGACGVRNVNAEPRGPGPFDAAFSEYPWQAMVLLESSKTILCGGVIVADDIVATSAQCIEGHQPYDILIKAGEWKLGRDEEPLKFQLVRASRLDIHPSNGMALIYLEGKLRIDRHIAPICLDASPPTPSDTCVTTGWGKPAISVHAQDAIMHHSPISIISSDECARQADGYRYGPGSVCGRPSIDACELDSGSALACLNSQGKYVMKGIYLSESQCGSQSPVITFGKPDLSWIKGNQPAASIPFPSTRPVTNEYLPPQY